MDREEEGLKQDSGKGRGLRLPIISISLSILGVVVPVVTLIFFDYLNTIPEYLVLFLLGLIPISQIVPFILGIIALCRSIRNHDKLPGKIFSIGGILMPILILTAIIVPNFTRYDARPIASEVKHSLYEIYAAYQSYHSAHGTYPTSPLITVWGREYNCFDIAGWKPIGRVKYTYECMSTPIYFPDWDKGKSAGKKCPGVVTGATPDSFTVAACGNIDEDDTLDVWTIDDAKNLRHLVDDLRK